MEYAGALERDLIVVVVVVVVVVTLARCVHFEPTNQSITQSINQSINVCFYTYRHSSVCVYG